MLKRSHATLGAVAGLAVANVTGEPLLAGAVVGSLAALAPDLDHPSSAVGRLLPAWWHRLTPGHRGPTHSLLWCAALGLACSFWSDVLALFAVAGALSHVCSDAITEQGVPWAWPISKRRVALPRLLALKTGGIAEALVVVGVLAVAGWWLTS
jgi:inner membrane protein